MLSSRLRCIILTSIALTMLPVAWIFGVTKGLGLYPDSRYAPDKSSSEIMTDPSSAGAPSIEKAKRSNLPTQELTELTGMARDVRGHPGYIAQPGFLRSGVKEFLDSKIADGEGGSNGYWGLLKGYENQFVDREKLYGDDILSPDYICGLGPGQGIEEPSGYKLMTEKLRISTGGVGESSLKLFCGVYTYSTKRNLVRSHALSWGYKCDGFLAFSNETIPTLGILDLIHDGDEDYQNMWQKVRSIWTYVYTNYLEDYDYFHLGGDDMYVIVPNLKRLLFQQSSTPNRPIHIGQWLPHKNMISGGPGYTLNAAALRDLVERGFPLCQTNTRSSAEDRLLSGCLQNIGILGNATDSRNPETAEQQYHDNHPSSLYTSRSSIGKRASYLAKNLHYWEVSQHPQGNGTLVGPRHELAAASTYSVSFHHLYSPQYVVRFHAILCDSFCPHQSPLGKGLVMHRKNAGQIEYCETS